MKTNEQTLDLALEAFWAKVAELHPERESGILPPTEAYDLELWGQRAVDVWLELNKPVYYVQRTVTMVVKIMGAETPEDAEANAADIQDADWYDRSLDTEYEYLVLNTAGKSVT